jgi:hypothetical protein
VVVPFKAVRHAGLVAGIYAFTVVWKMWMAKENPAKTVRRQ